MPMKYYSVDLRFIQPEPDLTHLLILIIPKDRVKLEMTWFLKTCSNREEYDFIFELNLHNHPSAFKYFYDKFESYSLKGMKEIFPIAKSVKSILFTNELDRAAHLRIKQSKAQHCHQSYEAL